MNYIEMSIFKFLQDVKIRPYKIPEELLSKFSTETKEALQKQFQREPRDFSLRMSNVGKPLCVLQMDKKHGSDTTEITRNLLGDLVEDVVLFLIHASGLKVISELERVSLNLGGIKLEGTYDIIIENPQGVAELYDIKSASEYSFKSKKEQSFKDFVEQDNFGYVSQLFGYSEAASNDPPKGYLEVKPGGFIFCNKTDGSVFVFSVPKDYEEFKKAALDTASNNIKAITKDLPFKRQFTDVEETFHRAKTGNRMLKMPCTFCGYKYKCWPDVRSMPQINSKSKNARMVDYTWIKE